MLGMKRRALMVLSALSLVLCLATAVLWVRSLGHRGYVWWIGSQMTVGFRDMDGVVGIDFTRDHGLYSPVSGTSRMYGWFFDGGPLGSRDRASLNSLSFNRWGFGVHVVHTVGRPRGNWKIGGRTLWIVYAPYWLLVALTAMPPLLLCRGALKSRRSPGLCRQCGYDLRATPERCPECGAVPVSTNKTD